MTLTEMTYIGCDAYKICFRNGIHRVEKNGELVFEGWYEKCRAYVKEREIAYLESRF